MSIQYIPPSVYFDIFFASCSNLIRVTCHDDRPSVGGVGFLTWGIGAAKEKADEEPPLRPMACCREQTCFPYLQ